MIRRLIDVKLAIAGLMLSAPLQIVIAVLITFDSPGPILYTPRMVGQNGKVFSLFRFRTMSSEPPDLNAQQRLTRVGRLIRNYSLDHLPILINLLKGDVTVVGPRPMELDTVDLGDPTWQHYFQVKPGLFNYAVLKLGRLWSPSRPSHPALNQELELEYRQKQSALRDLQLFFRSLRAFIASKGNIKARGKPDEEVERRVSDH